MDGVHWTTKWQLWLVATLVLLNRDIPAFANSVDPDQLASSEANWSGSALFVMKYYCMWICINLDEVIQLAEN